MTLVEEITPECTKIFLDTAKTKLQQNSPHAGGGLGSYKKAVTLADTKIWRKPLNYYLLFPK